MELNKQYDAQEAEPRLQKWWEKQKIYAFDATDKKRKIYSIDTPPPYASADHLHVGHGMHYSQFEFVARFQRMRGKNVFFPMGFDNNGLPTERFVENKLKINKNKVSRKEFIKLCLKESEKAGETYHDLFTSLGFSLDWSLLYYTIDDRSRRAAQKSFLELYEKGRLERIDQPTTWCVKCQTTIAQADLESLDIDSHFNDIIFKCKGKDLVIATTRPELLPACVALFYHPGDKRYKNLEGKFAKVPLFDYEVPILADDSVALDKGTGLMMVCTFGDKEDIEKWQKYKLELRVVLEEHGKLNTLAGKYKGMKIKEAREKILEDLNENKLLIKQEKITHPVNIHERCGTEIEFLKKPQWSIKVLDKKEELIEMGSKCKWYPDHMRIRYEHWVKNLQWNWGISRQRYYGVPFPVWYCSECNGILLASENDLPVDPREDKFKGKCSCGSTNIKGEMDVMDTWMTSSLTPEINAGWGGAKERKGFLPMSLRPQAHDIIRTWAFYTLVKSYYHHKNIPWSDVMISGHGQDPHGQKMSKSRGNFVVAQNVIKQYSADAFRFWAASVKLGDDLPYQEKDVVTGQKFVNKLWNASKFCLGHLEDYKSGKVIKIFDKWLISKLNKVIKDSTQSFEKYEYSRTKAEVEKFFWHTFCDYYLEIVKDRLYNSDTRGKKERESGQAALYEGLLSVLKMIAPIMPFITEEIYQVGFKSKEKNKSIHISAWPVFDKKKIDKEAEEIGDLGIEIIDIVRKFKSDRQLSMKAEIKVLVLVGSGVENKIKTIIDDLKGVLNVQEIKFKGKTSIESDKFKLKVGINL